MTDEHIKRRRIYGTWGNLKARCLDHNHSQYENYGGRGIKVCDRWIDPSIVFRKGRGNLPHQGFLNFLEDMGSTWFEGATIDRIDNDGDYTPENCRWVTKSENSREMTQRRIRDGSHHLLKGNGVTERIQKSAETMIRNGTSSLRGKGRITVFDSETNSFVRISTEEYYCQKNVRYFHSQSHLLKTMRGIHTCV